VRIPFGLLPVNAASSNSPAENWLDRVPIIVGTSAAVVGAGAVRPDIKMATMAEDTEAGQSSRRDKGRGEAWRGGSHGDENRRGRSFQWPQKAAIRAAGQKNQATGRVSGPASSQLPRFMPMMLYDRERLIEPPESIGFDITYPPAILVSPARSNMAVHREAANSLFHERETHRDFSIYRVSINALS
jgi:hypothetical protein